MGIWDSQAVSMCKQIGMDFEFAEARKAVETVVQNTEITNGEFVQAQNSESSKNKGN